MKYIILITTLLFTACGTAEPPQSQISRSIDTNTTSDIPDSDKAYIFLSMGQSNMSGIRLSHADSPALIDKEKVRMLSFAHNDISVYPDTVTWSKFNAVDHNLLDNLNYGELYRYNASCSLAQRWEDSDINETLYIITISKDGHGISPHIGDHANGLKAWRHDNDGKGYHAQSMHLFQVVLDDFIAMGKTPIIVGFNWNQWEANKPFLDPDVKQMYLDFFATYRAILPNDPPFYLYKPRSDNYGVEFRNIIDAAFTAVAEEDPNFTIIDALDSNASPVFYDDIKVHYTEEVQRWFGEQLFDNTIEWINNNI